jgi:Rrf2 family protein
MKISTKGRYALRIMVDLALHNNGEYISLKDISARQNITLKYTEQIVSTLGKAGYLDSMRGSNGGHRLAKAPSEYNVGDILRTMEGSLALASVVCSAETGGSDCPLANECSTAAFWQGLDRVVDKYINSFTLADLIGTAAAG